jgi:transketolase
MTHRPSITALQGAHDVPASLKRIAGTFERGQRLWIGPVEAATIPAEDVKAYEAAHQIMCHLCARAPTAHASGHPGGPLSSFTFAYWVTKRRDPSKDQPMRYSAGHLSLLAYGLQWMFGRGAGDERLKSPESIIETFRIPSGLPGHVEAGIGDIPFGTGPLGKGVSHALGTAYGLKFMKQPGMVDVLLADGDSQEGQVLEAFRLASHLKLDNLVVHGDWNDIQLSDLPSKSFATDMASIAEACGWNVIEVQNGNDPAQVVAALDEADKLSGSGRPTFVCYYTTMGHGISFMEEGSNTGAKNYHGSPLSKDDSEKAIAGLTPLDEAKATYEPFRQAELKRVVAKPQVETDIALTFTPKDYVRAVTKEKGAARKDFGATHLKALMKKDERIVVLHADLGASGGFDKLAKEYPARVINVGVAEGNMYMMAAGMRQAGMLPITYTFAAFGTNEARASARLIDINCGHTRCGVIHDCTHAGVSVGEDGETHQEQNYLNIPYRHTQVWMPGDSNQAAAMAEKALEIIAEGHESVYVFSSRMDHPQLLTPGGEPIYGADYAFDGKADLIRGKADRSDRLTILATGITIHAAVEAAERYMSENKTVSIRVVNVGCLRPLDAATVIAAALETTHLIVVEDHNIEGGLASQVADLIADFQLPCSLRRLGLTQFYPSGKAEDLLFFAGLDVDSIQNAIEEEIRTEVMGGEDALVTCVFGMLHHVHVSRFRERTEPFIERLKSEPGYLEELRAVWAERTVPADKLPSNDELRKRLSQEIQFGKDEDE